MHRSILAAFIFLAISSTLAQTQAGPDRTESCRKFVQHFYDWYVPAWNKAAIQTQKDSPQETMLKRKQNLLAPELLAALRDDWAAQEKNPQEIVGFDADPYTLSQDPEDAYVAGTPVKVGDNFKVPIYGVRARAKSTSPLLFAIVREVSGTWQFVDFTYADGKQNGLLAILQQMKVQRESDPSVKK